MDSLGTERDLAPAVVLAAVALDLAAVFLAATLTFCSVALAAALVVAFSYWFLLLSLPVSSQY